MRRPGLASSLILLGAGLLGWLVSAGPLGGSLDRALEPLRFAAAPRSASGQVVIVEMDAASTAVIKRWPWSRTHYARAVDTLRRAGAASIVFDVEFSSPSDPAGDAAFAAALQRAEGLVVLPTFGQQAGTGDERNIDALPIASLRRHAALASVNIAPGADGAVREMPFGTITAGVPRPSLSSYIAARSGQADTTFPIDMAIDPATIPRLSFVAVRDGRFDPLAVRGRNVLIGATAIEMGDRYGTTSWGVLPGVIVQALAAETLLRGVPTGGSPLLPFALALILAALIVTLRQPRWLVGATVGALAGVIGLTLLAQYQVLVFYPLAGAIVILTTAALAGLGRAIFHRFALQRETDPATGLPNRLALLNADAGHAAGMSLAVAQIGNFEQVMAVLGAPAATNAVLRVAERLRVVIENGAIHRIDDRHLAFWMSHDQLTAEHMAGLRTLLLQPVEAGGRRIDIGITIGTATDAADHDRLLADAMMAADRAHAEGVFWIGADTDLSDLERSISLMGELDQALADGTIAVHYQPKLHLASDRITSVEALVRWPHATRGFIGPDVFVTLAEQTDRIAPLTLYVFDRVLADLTHWHAAGAEVSAAINISAKLVSSIAFSAMIEARLLAAGPLAAALIFEVTESAALSDPVAAVAALHRFKALGVKVSMDDYGTGQSTLTYLRQLPLSELKIDRSFVQHAHRNRNDALLVRSTVDLAHELGLTVVAEGVEDAECLAFLTGIGCDLIQGYLISKPVPAQAIADLLTAQDARGRRASA